MTGPVPTRMFCYYSCNFLTTTILAAATAATIVARTDMTCCDSWVSSPSAGMQGEEMGVAPLLCFHSKKCEVNWQLECWVWGRIFWFP